MPAKKSSPNPQVPPEGNPEVDPKEPKAPETPPEGNPEGDNGAGPEGNPEDDPKPTLADFGIMVFEDLPDLGRPNPKAAPWRSKWDIMAPLVLEDGRTRGFFVPLSWYVKERAVAEDKATHGYVKQKLSDDWKKWLTGEATRADNFELVKVNRTGKEQDYKELGAGVLALMKKRRR